MVKEKHESSRLYDNDGYKKRAACVCVKNENENEVLLISSSRNKNFWVIPGGGIEDNENPEDAAEREVYEEAGVQGRLGRLLGIFEVFENKERKHRTNVYLLIVDKEHDDWEEQKLGRIRRWFNLEDAKSELEKHKPVQGTYLNLLKGFEKLGYLKNLNTYPSNEAQDGTAHVNIKCHSQSSPTSTKIPLPYSSSSSYSNSADSSSISPNSSPLH